MAKNELNPWALGSAIGLACGLFMIFIAGAAAFGWGGEWLGLLSAVYIGFAATPLGAIAGFVWGFIDGFIFGALVAVFYNLSMKYCPLCK